MSIFYNSQNCSQTADGETGGFSCWFGSFSVLTTFLISFIGLLAFLLLSASRDGKKLKLLKLELEMLRGQREQRLDINIIPYKIAIKSYNSNIELERKKMNSHNQSETLRKKENLEKSFFCKQLTFFSL